jgi:arginyl-tRNA synthetase
VSPTTIELLRSAVEAAADTLVTVEGSAPRARPTLERPKKAEFGDFSTNAAMLYAPLVRASPRDVATRLAEELTGRLGAGLDRAEVAGPGFLNLFLSDAWHADALRDLLAAGDGFGAGGAARPQRYNVEFVSSNPTGPVHVGHARNAAYGDALARVLAFHGHDVFREFYVNDAGTQVQKFAESVRARAAARPSPRTATRASTSPTWPPRSTARRRWTSTRSGASAVERMLDRTRGSLARLPDHDGPVLQRALAAHARRRRSSGRSRPARARHAVRARGRAVGRRSRTRRREGPGARRSTGEHTYFASDIAYHWDKRERGFERLCDVWGSTTTATSRA